MTLETEKEYARLIKLAERSKKRGGKLTPNEKLMLHVEGRIAALEREVKSREVTIRTSQKLIRELKQDLAEARAEKEKAWSIAGDLVDKVE